MMHQLSFSHQLRSIETQYGVERAEEEEEEEEEEDAARDEEEDGFGETCSVSPLYLSLGTMIATS